MKRSPLLVIFITIFIDLVGFGIVIPVLPYYAEGTRFGATPREVGLLFASYSVMQLIFAPVLGRSFWHLARPVEKINLKRIGVTEIIYSLVFLVFITLTFRLA